MDGRVVPREVSCRRLEVRADRPESSGQACVESSKKGFPGITFPFGHILARDIRRGLFPQRGIDHPRYLDGLQSLDYPDVEVILVNDGSTDSTPEIASHYPVRLITTENRGLSHARNNGINAATKEIIAFIDDDAYPDEDWLRFLALSLKDT